MPTALAAGNPAVDQGVQVVLTGYMVMFLDNPCNVNGFVTAVNAWLNLDGDHNHVGAFFDNGTKWECRSVVDLGNITGTGLKSVATRFLMHAGDCLGIYFEAARVSSATTGGAGWLYQMEHALMVKGAQFYHFGDAVVPYFTADWLASINVTGLQAFAHKIGGTQIANKIGGVLNGEIACVGGVAT
jgi:hypothetical protein